MRKRDGFLGEKMLSLPASVRKHMILPDPVLSRLYVEQIGYFPKAAGHYRRRREGCTDNILIYCVRGKGWYRVKEKHFELSPNQFVILPATRDFLSYGADEKDPWTIYWVHFSGHDVDIFNQRFGIGSSHEPRAIMYNEKGLQLWDTIYRNLETGFTNETLGNANLCLYHLIATFLYPGSATTPDNTPPLKTTRDLIDDSVHFMRGKLDQILTVKELATECGLSASHYSHLFHKTTGLPPLEYFIRLKLERACIFLYDSELKVKDISTRVGYDDPYYFSRLFKKHMNMSPQEYRGLHAGRVIAAPREMEPA
ncbi:MAG TPA: AraC family transcriptional regulator [Dinghuibacter sp.]|uniref:AraC family transcriptional regulator n=1 Tax=Dinghuibacter sp. TaxID=2024697 RepID=UPI002CB01C95|nr:AraC family transcriptional regulator [Dinghuibacter sp.]HTJ10788.1 AraC family transcriptional regulator [Dinghuibacter sp.]